MKIIDPETHYMYELIDAEDDSSILGSGRYTVIKKGNFRLFSKKMIKYIKFVKQEEMLTPLKLSQ